MAPSDAPKMADVLIHAALALQGPHYRSAAG